MHYPAVHETRRFNGVRKVGRQVKTTSVKHLEVPLESRPNPELIIASVEQPEEPGLDEARVPKIREVYRQDIRVKARTYFRRLLREASYLPDEHARKWVRQHIISTFRARHLSPQSKSDLPGEEGAKSGLARARRSLQVLSRANMGELKPLIKVLQFAYGRCGRRKHELLRPIMQSGDDNPVLQEAKLRLGTAKLKKDRDAALVTKYGNLPTAVQKLLESQIAQSIPPLIGKLPRSLDPNIPEFNSWRKAMPLSRRKNQLKEWYKQMLSRLYPPLPKNEWQSLRSKAHGDISMTLPVVRRKVASRLPNHPETVPDPLKIVVVEGKPQGKVFGNRDAHALTKRMMQHICADVFALCPLMEWDTSTQDWNITWGDQALLVTEEEWDRLVKE